MNLPETFATLSFSDGTAKSQKIGYRLGPSHSNSTMASTREDLEDEVHRKDLPANDKIAFQ